MLFKDRQDAGRKLAEKLLPFKEEDPIVLALPRGGVPLGIEAARLLDAPLDLVIIRKIRHPSNPEYAIGAVGEEGDPLLHSLEVERVNPRWLQTEIKKQRQEIKRRKEMYLPSLSGLEWKDRTVLLIDDGAATGFTMLAAIKQLRAMHVQKIVAALPVVSPDTYDRLNRAADEVVAVEVPDVFLGGVGAYYQDFRQVPDEEVMEMLEDFLNQ